MRIEKLDQFLEIPFWNPLTNEMKRGNLGTRRSLVTRLIIKGICCLTGFDPEHAHSQDAGFAGSAPSVVGKRPMNRKVGLRRRMEGSTRCSRASRLEPRGRHVAARGGSFDPETFWLAAHLILYQLEDFDGGGQWQHQLQMKTFSHRTQENKLPAADGDGDTPDDDPRLWTQWLIAATVAVEWSGAVAVRNSGENSGYPAIPVRGSATPLCYLELTTMVRNRAPKIVSFDTKLKEKKIEREKRERGNREGIRNKAFFLVHERRKNQVAPSEGGREERERESITEWSSGNRRMAEWRSKFFLRTEGLLVFGVQPMAVPPMAVPEELSSLMCLMHSYWVSTVKNVIEKPHNDHLPLIEASRLCNMDIISHVQQVICFAFHDSRLLMETCQEAKNLRKIVTLFYLD
ncbi:hypothetical protein CR513_01259, partial [Mucuna pruriens]